MLHYNKEDFSQDRIRVMTVVYRLILNNAKLYNITIKNVYFNVCEPDYITFETKEELFLYKLFGAYSEDMQFKLKVENDKNV